jgi:CDP-glucose 4,6-dehydratase
MFGKFFSGRKVVVTGHTGFKGSWLTQWLLGLGSRVTGFALDPQDHEVLFQQLDLHSRLENDLRGDIRDRKAVNSLIAQGQPDIVFHLAAQPLVRLSYEKPVDTFETNVLGTVNLLNALVEYDKPCAVVIVTTDKCYENKEWLHAYREEDPMGGYDPYSASKACAEIVTASFRSSFFAKEGGAIRVATARAGNVIGGGDWAKDRIVPDLMRATFDGLVVPVRNKSATRPWQHVLEPISGYLWLAASLGESTLAGYPVGALCSAFNFGPSLDSNRTVAELVDSFQKITRGSWRDCSNPNEPHEASKLNLAIDKAFHMLNWKPSWQFQECVEQTAKWYLEVRDGADPLRVTEACIKDYVLAARHLGLTWSAS